jgi:hypothetical protein
LGDLGVLPGRRPCLVEGAPFGGTLFVEVGDGRQALGLDLAHCIMVQSLPDGLASGANERRERDWSGDRAGRGKGGDEAAAE